MIMFGHRGLPLQYPENTLIGFHAALIAGAHGVELDVHISSDGEPVVIHDETLNRTTNCTGNVADTPVAALRTLGIPDLPTILASLPADAYILIELKTAAAALPVAHYVIEAIANGKPRERIIIISFNHDALSLIHDHHPALMLGASMEDYDVQDVERAAALPVQAIILYYKHLTLAMLKHIHHSQKQAIAWTVNEAPIMQQLRDMGIDGIITDDVSLALMQYASN